MQENAVSILCVSDVEPFLSPVVWNTVYIYTTMGPALKVEWRLFKSLG